MPNTSPQNFLLSVCWKGKVRYYDQKVHASVVFHGNYSERLKLQGRVTLGKSVGRISTDFIFSCRYYCFVTLYSFIILSVMTLMLAALRLTIFKMFWDRQPQV